MKAVAKKKINVGNAEDDTMPGPTPAQIKAAKAKAEEAKKAAAPAPEATERRLVGSVLRAAASVNVSTIERMSRIGTPSVNRFCRVRVMMPSAILPGTRSSTSLGDFAASLSSNC